MLNTCSRLVLLSGRFWKHQIVEPLGTSMSVVVGSGLKVKTGSAYLSCLCFRVILPPWCFASPRPYEPHLQGLCSEVSETISWNTLFLSWGVLSGIFSHQQNIWGIYKAKFWQSQGDVGFQYNRVSGGRSCTVFCLKIYWGWNEGLAGKVLATQIWESQMGPLAPMCGWQIW